MLLEERSLCLGSELHSVLLQCIPPWQSHSLASQHHSVSLCVLFTMIPCQPMARLNSLVTPCKKEWYHSVMMSPPVIKTQKMDKTKKIIVIPRIALPYFHYDFWHLLGKLSKTWVMQQNARSKQIQQTGSLWRGTVHTHTPGHWQPAFINTFPCLFETLYSVSHYVSWGALSVGWRYNPRSWMLVHEPGPPPLPHLSLCSLLGVYMLYTNAFIYKAFPS